MGKLIYSAIASLDGYVADERGDFGWARPDDELHAFVNDLERPIGTHLYGRRMYEVMRYWQTHDTAGDSPEADFARIWQAADNVVYSRTLDAVTTERTRLEREFDADSLRAMKDAAAGDLSIGGPELAAHAFAAGLVDECHMFVVPAVVGRGTAAFQVDSLTELQLVDEHRFAGGAVHLHYVVSS